MIYDYSSMGRLLCYAIAAHSHKQQTSVLLLAAGMLLEGHQEMCAILHCS
jgi:hypothetical protein